MILKTMTRSLLLLLLGLAGCASLPEDLGRSDVRQLAADRGRSLPSLMDVRTVSPEELEAPMTIDRAIQLALTHNPAMRRDTARLGFAAAEVYEAGRMANPTFSMTRLSPGDPAAVSAQLTLGIAINFVNLLFLPANHRYAEAQMESAKLAVAAYALDLAAEVEIAWYDMAGSEQLAQMREKTAKAARVSADLAQRYHAAGNLSAREHAMEQAAASSAMLVSLAARVDAVDKRSRLNRLMGLSAQQNVWTLDARLAEPFSQDEVPEDLQRLSLESRLDVASLRRQAAAIADRYGFTRRTRVINGLEIGMEREKDFDGFVNKGPTLSLELPLFNWGGGRMAAIQAALDQAEADLDARVLDVSNEVQRTSTRMNLAKVLAAEYRERLIPQREAIVARAQEEQNYMLIGVFELILAKQQEYEAYAGYIEAVRDYWIARAELTRAVGRQLPGSKQETKPTMAPAEVLQPEIKSMNQGHHHRHGPDPSPTNNAISPVPDAHGAH